MNHTISLRIIPCKYWFTLGPGWAALGSALASGVLRFEGNFWALNAAWLIKLGLFWLLVDPVLGTLWRLIVLQGLRRQLTYKTAPKGLTVKSPFPYTAQKSTAYRLASLTAFLRSQSDGRWQTAFILPFIALGLAAVLGWPLVLYTIVTLLLTFWLGGAAFRNRILQRLFWQSLAAFLGPYIIGLMLMGGVEKNALLLGAGYWVVAFGALLLSAGRAAAYRPVIIGQGAIALLLFALLKPIPATMVSLAALFSLLLRLNVKQQEVSPWEQYAAQLHPFLLSGFLIAAVSLGSVG